MRTTIFVDPVSISDLDRVISDQQNDLGYSPGVHVSASYSDARGGEHVRPRQT